MIRNGLTCSCVSRIPLMSVIHLRAYLSVRLLCSILLVGFCRFITFPRFRALRIILMMTTIGLSLLSLGTRFSKRLLFVCTFLYFILYLYECLISVYSFQN